MSDRAAIGERSRAPKTSPGSARAFAIGLALLALTTGVRRAVAADDWARLGVPDRVTAGRTITIELARSAPRDVEEMEILLSLDDGRTFPVRVTREIAAGEHEIRWKVPALASAAARLRVRFGEAGRETWGPPSEPFTIVTDGEPADLHLFHENGWWEGLDPAPADGGAGEFAAGGATLAVARALPPFAVPSTSSGISSRAPARLLEVLASSAPETPGDPDRSILRARFFPLRN